MKPRESMNEKQLLMCDFHDARIEAIVLRRSGDCEITFELLPCYFAVPDKTDVADLWAARGTLMLQGCENLRLCDVLPSELWVVDSEFEYAISDAHDKYNLPVLNGKKLVSGRIHFNNGGVIEISGGWIQLRVADCYEQIEQCAWP